MKDSVGRASLPAGPEPQLPADFASRAIEKAERIRSRRRRTKIALGATAAAGVLVALLSMRPVTQNNQPAARIANAPSSEIASASLSETVYASNDEDPDLTTIMMPDARAAENFDASYGPAGWSSYTAWNPVSYDPYR